MPAGSPISSPLRLTVAIESHPLVRRAARKGPWYAHASQNVVQVAGRVHLQVRSHAVTANQASGVGRRAEAAYSAAWSRAMVSGDSAVARQSSRLTSCDGSPITLLTAAASAAAVTGANTWIASGTRPL